jgi:hypothetical protein
VDEHLDMAATPMMISVVSWAAGWWRPVRTEWPSGSGQCKADEVGSQVAIDAGEIGRTLRWRDAGGSVAAPMCVRNTNRPRPMRRAGWQLATDAPEVDANATDAPRWIPGCDRYR